MGRGDESLIAKSRSHDQDDLHAHIWLKPFKNLLLQNRYWYMKQISGERLQDHWSSCF